MSFVTTARSRRARRLRHRDSTSAVLPDPTGPPTPTLSACCSFISSSVLLPWISHHLTTTLATNRASANLRTKQPRVLRLVPGGCHGEARDQAPDLLVAQA